jgi:hypothetical protein
MHKFDGDIHRIFFQDRFAHAVTWLLAPQLYVTSRASTSVLPRTATGQPSLLARLCLWLLGWLVLRVVLPVVLCRRTCRRFMLERSGHTDSDRTDELRHLHDPLLELLPEQRVFRIAIVPVCPWRRIRAVTCDARTAARAPRIAVPRQPPAAFDSATDSSLYLGDVECGLCRCKCGLRLADFRHCVFVRVGCRSGVAWATNNDYKTKKMDWVGSVWVLVSGDGLKGMNVEGTHTRTVYDAFPFQTQRESKSSNVFLM